MYKATAGPCVSLCRRAYIYCALRGDAARRDVDVCRSDGLAER